MPERIEGERASYEISIPVFSSIFWVILKTPTETAALIFLYVGKINAITAITSRRKIMLPMLVFRILDFI